MNHAILRKSNVESHAIALQTSTTLILLLTLLGLIFMSVLTGCSTPELIQPEPEPIASERYIPEVVVPDMLTIPVYYQAKGLHSEAREILDEYIDSLDQPEKLVFTVEGYTCNQGYRAYNKKLSLWRAQAVKNHMVSRGIDPDSIDVLGHGMERPVASNKTRLGRVKNRRVTITAERAD